MNSSDRKKHEAYTYPAIRVNVLIRDRKNSVVTEYSFWLDDASARRAFAARCTDAWLAGQTVTTKQEVGAPKYRA